MEHVLLSLGDGHHHHRMDEGVEGYIDIVFNPRDASNKFPIGSSSPYSYSLSLPSRLSAPIFFMAIMPIC